VPRAVVAPELADPTARWAPPQRAVRLADGSVHAPSRSVAPRDRRRARARRVAAARERRRRALRFTSLIDCSTRVLRAPARMPRSLALYPNFIAFSNRNFPRNPV